MTLRLNSLPIPHADKSSPVRSSKLYVFRAGTTDPADVYREKTHSKAHPHPIPAQPDGQFPDIFMPAGRYKVDVRAASGASVPGFPVDNLVIPNDAATIDTRYPLELFGGGATASAEANKAAIEAAWAELQNKGGTIVLPVGFRIPFARSVFPPTSRTITIEGAGRYGTAIEPADPNPDPTGAPTDYMWTFQSADGGNTAVSLVGFALQGRIDPATAQHGIHVQNSNQAVMRDLWAIHIAGTAFRFDRLYNARVSVRTRSSGNAAHNAHSMLIQGDPREFPDEDDNDPVFNDVVLETCTTEQDEYGHGYYYGTLLRTSGPYKVHGRGSATDKPAVTIHRVSRFDLELTPTHHIRADSLIEVSDFLGGRAQPAPTYTPTKSAEFCQGELRLYPIYTLTAKRDQSAVVLLDCTNRSSRVAVRGMVHDLGNPDLAQDGTLTAHWVRISPASVLARIDLSDLRGGEDFNIGTPASLVDDLRPDAAARTLPVAEGQGVALGRRTEFYTAGPNPQGLSEFAAYEMTPTTVGPPSLYFGFRREQGVDGIEFFGPQAFSLSVPGEVAAATVVTPGLLLPMPIAGETGAQANVVRLVVSAGGVATTYDPDNHWQVRLARNASDVDSYTLRKASADPDAPDRDVSTEAGRLYDWWTKLAGGSASVLMKHQALSVRLVPVGAPPPLSNVGCQVFFTLTH